MPRTLLTVCYCGKCRKSYDSVYSVEECKAKKIKCPCGNDVTYKTKKVGKK
jgi:hypothetical protein